MTGSIKERRTGAENTHALIGLCMSFAACLSTLCVSAVTFTAIPGKSDWTDPASFSVGGQAAVSVPGSSDTVDLTSPGTWSFTSGTDSFNVMANVKEIRFANDAQNRFFLEVEVPVGTEASLNCAIYPQGTTVDTSLYRCCDIVKKGAGVLKLLPGTSFVGNINNAWTWTEDSSKCNWKYYANIRVGEGVVRLLPECASKSCYVGIVEVSDGATMYLPNQKNTVNNFTCQCRGLKGDGAVVNDQATSPILEPMPYALLQKELTDGQLVFSGMCKDENPNGNLRVCWSGPQKVFGGKSTYKGATMIWSNGGNFTSEIRSGYGVTETDRLGLRGQTSTFGSGAEIAFQALGGALLYGGSGETTDKQFTFATPSENNKIPIYFSAGNSGGVTFDGSDYTKTRWYAEGGDHDTRVVLSGDNAIPMRVKCPIVGKSDAQALYFLKRGKGAWSFENDTTENGGSYAIEEGAIRFSSLDETGCKSSLGAATRLHTFHEGKQTLADLDATLGSPFAVTLCATSAVTRGALEYIGLKATGASDRKIGLSGFGGKIVNNGNGALFLNDVTACAAGETALVVGGTNSDDNVICNVTNGVGNIALIKEGTGKWTVSHNIDVDSVEVKGGTLVLERTTGKSYSWFKFIMKEARNWTSDGGGTVKANCWPFIEEFILQDSGGNRVFTNPVSDDVAEGGTSSMENWRKIVSPINCHGIGPNSIAYGCRGEIRGGGWNASKSCLDDRLATNLFDNVKSACSCGFAPTMWNGGTTGPTRDRPDSWVEVVMRLPVDAPHVDACDLVAATGGGYENELFAWALEGSRDGIHWETITNYSPTVAGKDLTHRYGNEYWSLIERYGTADTSKIRWTPGQTKAPSPNGYHFAGAVTNEYAFPSSLDYVKVSGGGTLKIDSSDSLTIANVTVDAATGGTIVNGSYAASGMLTIENVGNDQRIEVPGSFVGLNIGDWTVTLPPNARNRDVVVRADGKMVITKRGLILMVR